MAGSSRRVRVGGSGARPSQLSWPLPRALPRFGVRVGAGGTADARQGRRRGRIPLGGSSRKGFARRAPRGDSGEAGRRRELVRAAREERRGSAGARLERSRLAVAIEARLAVRAGVAAQQLPAGAARRRLRGGALPVPLEALPATRRMRGREPVRPRPPCGAEREARRRRGRGRGALARRARRARGAARRAGAPRRRHGGESARGAHARGSRARRCARAQPRGRPRRRGGAVAARDTRRQAEQLGRPAVPSPAGAPVVEGSCSRSSLRRAALRRAGPRGGGLRGIRGRRGRPSRRPRCPRRWGSCSRSARPSRSSPSRPSRSPGPGRRSPRRRPLAGARFSAAGAMGYAALAAAVGAAAASSASWAHVVLLAAVPFGAALLLDLAARARRRAGARSTARSRIGIVSARESMRARAWRWWSARGRGLASSGDKSRGGPAAPAGPGALPRRGRGARRRAARGRGGPPPGAAGGVARHGRELNRSRTCRSPRTEPTNVLVRPVRSGPRLGAVRRGPAQHRPANLLEAGGDPRRGRRRQPASPAVPLDRARRTTPRGVRVHLERMLERGERALLAVDRSQRRQVSPTGASARGSEGRAISVEVPRARGLAAHGDRQGRAGRVGAASLPVDGPRDPGTRGRRASPRAGSGRSPAS